MTKLTEMDCVFGREYPAKLRVPTVSVSTSVLGFRYLEVTKQGDVFVAEEKSVMGTRIRALGATSESELRAAILRNQWAWIR